MRLVHTSDWHLGHTLHGLPRDAEHAAFLQWLLDLIARERPDAMLITGDVFETANPPARAERAWFDFLALAREARPGLSILVIAGNHDAPSRLEAPAPLLERLGVRVIGTSRDRAGVVLPEKMVVPLTLAETGEVGAWVAAVPFLRPSDLPPAPAGLPPERAEVEQVRALYASVLELARARRRPGQALLATGHLPFGVAPPARPFAAPLAASGSERPVQIGRLHALPVDLFPEDLDYVALGHIHRPQALGRETVRYAGSPIPLSLAERDYRHQVVVVDLPGGVRALEVPRRVELLRLPEGEPGAPDEVLALLAALPERAGEATESAFLEVRVRLREPDPALRRRIEEALRGKAARLVKLSVERPEAAPEAGLSVAAGGLAALEPLEVLRRCWARERADAPPPAVEAAYLELVAEAEADAARDESIPPAPAPPLVLPRDRVADALEQERP